MSFLRRSTGTGRRSTTAIAPRSNALVFEVVLDADAQRRMQDYIKARGLLPAGQHLHDMISPDARKELDAEVAKLPLPPEGGGPHAPMARGAGSAIDVADITKDHYSAASGVDVQLQAHANGKSVVGLETVEQQLALLAPGDPKTEVEAFEADLKSAAETENDEIGPLIDAWMHGRVDRIASLTQKELADYPDAKNLLFDDRNKAWVGKIATYLDQSKVYFITVGAGHLAGPLGVPALLRKRGLNVEGP